MHGIKELAISKMLKSINLVIDIMKGQYSLLHLVIGHDYEKIIYVFYYIRKMLHFVKKRCSFHLTIKNFINEKYK